MNINMKQVIGFNKPTEPNGYLSNWYAAPFTVDGKQFTNVEQYMLYLKAVMFGAEDTAAQILRTADQTMLKQLGRLIWNANNTVWNGLRQIALCKALREKFGQNDNLRAQLLSTGDAILANCAGKENVFGTGLDLNADFANLHNWNGQNLLGFTLMYVRDQFKG